MNYKLNIIASHQLKVAYTKFSADSCTIDFIIMFGKWNKKAFYIVRIYVMIIVNKIKNYFMLQNKNTQYNSDT